MKQRNSVAKTALCGVFGALGAVILLLGGVIPAATFVCPALASLLLIPALRECGTPRAAMLFGIVAAIALLLGPDKEAAGLFLLLGYYPLVKPRLDAIRPRPLRALAKLALFNGAVFALYFSLIFLFHMGDFSAEFQSYSRWMLLLLLVLGNISALLFDRLIPRFAWLYEKKLRPKVMPKGMR